MKLRNRILLVGAVLGALFGVAAAQLYLRSASVQVDEEGEEHLPTVQPGKALAVGLGALTVLKQIVGLGSEE
jgi:hypothetical protein